MDDTMDSLNTPEEGYNRAYYRDDVRCFVPTCKRYRRDFPDVQFLGVPKNLKEIWCHAIDIVCPRRQLFVCEEHINIEQDCSKTKSGILRLKRTANLSLLRTYDLNVQEMETSEIDGTINIPTTSTPMSQVHHDSKGDFACQTKTCTRHKAVLVKPTVRSVGCAANIKITTLTEKIMPSQPQIASSATSGTSTPSIYVPSSPASSSSTSCKENKPPKDLSGRNHMLSIITDNPKMYIGVPKQYFWLIDFLSKECKLRPLHIIVTLFKIKQNDTMKRICDHFNLSEATVVDIFKICMPRLASYLQNFVFLPEPHDIKKTLPPAFKARFANVQCILDAFEIQIERPSDPVIQARTWSQYKSANTVKYLVACCPNGFICFISKGYGGRISDKAITGKSGFVDILPPGAAVLADRGFKGIETALRERHIQLLRPPSVSSKETPTKKEVMQSKVIASLRIHVERLIRRVREFKFLKPHSVVNHNHIKYLDESVIIVCALVNLQGNIVKTQ